jgi:hypothetical protein
LPDGKKKKKASSRKSLEKRIKMLENTLAALKDPELEGEGWTMPNTREPALVRQLPMGETDYMPESPMGQVYAAQRQHDLVNREAARSPADRSLDAVTGGQPHPGMEQPVDFDFSNLARPQARPFGMADEASEHQAAMLAAADEPHFAGAQAPSPEDIMLMQQVQQQAEVQGPQFPGQGPAAYDPSGSMAPQIGVDSKLDTQVGGISAEAAPAWRQAFEEDQARERLISGQRVLQRLNDPTVAARQAYHQAQMAKYAQLAQEEMEAAQDAGGALGQSPSGFGDEVGGSGL